MPAGRPAVIHFKPWQWRSDDTPTTIPGFRIQHSNGKGIFVPYTEAHNLADRIVDYTEQHEREHQ